MRRFGFVLLVLLCLVGCPPSPSDSALQEQFPDPDVADIIPVTSAMTPMEVLMVNELNQAREIKWDSSREHRNEILTAFAILKSRGQVTVEKITVEED